MTTAVIRSPPATPERTGGMAGTATWSRTTSAVSQRMNNRSQQRSLRRQPNISSHVLGFRRNHRAAFLPSLASSLSATASATALSSTASASASSSESASASAASSLFRIGYRTSSLLAHPTTDSSPSLPASHGNNSISSKERQIDSLLHLLKAVRHRDPSVQHIVLEGRTLPWQYTAALLRAVGDSPYVWRVQLRKVGADDRLAPALRDCVEKSTSLIDLDLSKNHLKGASAQALEEGLHARASRQGKDATTLLPLQRLNLEGNPLSPDALRLLSLGLSAGATPNLQILKLGKNPQCGAAGVAVLCETLLLSSFHGHHPCPVTWLDVRGNALGDEGCWSLAQALADVTCPLEYLSMQRNGITNEGVAALAQAMEGNTRLQTLDVQRNADVDNAGASALLAALWKNHSFTKLKLRCGTKVTDASIQNELADLMLINTYGTTLAAATKDSLQRLQAKARHDDSSTGNDSACVICFEANRSVGHTFGTLLPCRHDNACWACCQRLRGHCHMCRSVIVKVVAA